MEAPRPVFNIKLLIKEHVNQLQDTRNYFKSIRGTQLYRFEEGDEYKFVTVEHLRKAGANIPELGELEEIPDQERYPIPRKSSSSSSEMNHNNDEEEEILDNNDNDGNDNDDNGGMEEPNDGDAMEEVGAGEEPNDDGEMEEGEEQQPDQQDNVKREFLSVMQTTFDDLWLMHQIISVDEVEMTNTQRYTPNNVKRRHRRGCKICNTKVQTVCKGCNERIKPTMTSDQACDQLYHLCRDDIGAHFAFKCIQALEMKLDGYELVKKA